MNCNNWLGYYLVVRVSSKALDLLPFKQNAVCDVAVELDQRFATKS